MYRRGHARQYRPLPPTGRRSTSAASVSSSRTVAFREGPRQDGLEPSRSSRSRRLNDRAAEARSFRIDAPRPRKRASRMYRNRELRDRARPFFLVVRVASRRAP